MTQREDSAIGTADLSRMLAGLRNGLAAAGDDDAERIDRVRLLEEMRAVVAAVQLDETAAFDRSQRAAQAQRGVPKERQGRGVAAQVALARRISPWQAQRYLGWARTLPAELPATMAELRAGRTSEWRTVIVARETAMLSAADRGTADTQIAPLLGELSDRRVDTAVKRLAYRLDPHSAVARLRTAEGERRVSLRPRPDLMSSLTGVVPLPQGVAMLAALRRDADAAIGTGANGGRSRSQLMADLLVERVTGQSRASEVGVEVDLLVPAETLLAATGDDTTDGSPAVFAHEPALLGAEGVAPVPVPAGYARSLIADARDGTRIWLRRVFTAPGSGELAAMESRRRLFTPQQRRLLRLRDQYCATPWCGAPIRHADHVQPVEDGGPTSIANAQGLCAACNYAKQADGLTYSVRRTRDGPRETVVRTPTGHEYRSQAPDPPGSPRAGPGETRLRGDDAA